MSQTVTAQAEPSFSIAHQGTDDRERPLPEVPIFDNATATAEQIVQGLIKAGGCVVKGVVPPEAIAEIEKDTRPYLDADTEWNGDFFPKVCLSHDQSIV